MNTFSHKAVVASLCTALGFVLGASPEAKAASFTFIPTIKFTLLDGGISGAPFDGLGDTVSSSYFGVLIRGTEGEVASFAEFTIGNFSVAPNKFISSAVFQTVTNRYLTVYGLGVGEGIRPSRLGLFGYAGNGAADVSDFEAGLFLGSVDVSSSFERAIILNFDVTSFINQQLSNGNGFAGFGIRALDFGGMAVVEQDYDIPLTKLIIETPNVVEPVPEPTTIFGSAIGLCLGGWLKRKKSSQQNKKAPQR